MELQIIDTLDGSTISTDLFGLSRNIKTGLLNQVMDDGTVVQLGLITDHDMVRFARIWSGWVNPHSDETEEVAYFFELIDRWIEDPGSVTLEEIHTAGSDAEYVTRMVFELANDVGDRKSIGSAIWCVARTVLGKGASTWYAVQDTAREVAAAKSGDVAWVSGGAAGSNAKNTMFRKQGEMVLETLSSR